MTPEELEQIAEDERATQGQFAHRVNVCVAAGCMSCQSQNVKDALDKEITARGWEKKCQSKGVGCMGLCAEGPLVSTSRGTLYQHVTAADAGEILDALDRNQSVDWFAAPTLHSSKDRKKSFWKIPASWIRNALRNTWGPRDMGR